MRKLSTVFLSLVLALPVVPVFAAPPAAPATAPAAAPSGDPAIPAGVLDALFAPTRNATPAMTGATPQFGSNFYGYCSGDCSPCFSGDHPQCPIDPNTGFTQYCTTVPLC